MRLLSGTEATRAEEYMREAGKIAEMALCKRDKCGALIVKDGVVLGFGYNAPPNNDPTQAHCANEYSFQNKPKSDRTCCVHAEWRALLAAVKSHGDNIAGSSVYFTRVDEEGNLLRSGQPYCSVCSRLALDSGIQEFVLWHEEGISAYTTKEYNQSTYNNLT